MGPIDFSDLWRAGLALGIIIGLIVAGLIVGLIWLFDHLHITWVS